MIAHRLTSSKTLGPTIALALALVTGAGPAAAMSDIDRKLLVAVAGYGLDEPAALKALGAGADINARNEAMDDDTLLIAAIRQQAPLDTIRWLLAKGADPTLENRQGKTALAYFSNQSESRTPAGQEILRLLGGTATAAAAPAPNATPPVPATPPAPGVYECYGQNAMVSMMAFGLIDGSSYMNANGRRGRYSYDAASGVLTLDPGGEPARFQRVSDISFRPLRENGELGGFACPLNRAKNPSRPPW